MTAASINASPTSEAARSCDSAKPATSALPSMEKNQKAGFGRSPPRMTPKMAVASGNSPMKTIECAEVTCCRASAVSKGKPTTTPSATTSSEAMSRRAGRFSLNRRRRQSASAPAIPARATVRKTGSNCRTATRVAGSDPLKITTPIMPLIKPATVRSMSRKPSLREPYRPDRLVPPETVRYDMAKLLC